MTRSFNRTSNHPLLLSCHTQLFTGVDFAVGAHATTQVLYILIIDVPDALSALNDKVATRCGAETLKSAHINPSPSWTWPG